MTPEQSVSAMLPVIESRGIQHSGTFWTWEGKVQIFFFSILPLLGSETNGQPNSLTRGRAGPVSVAFYASRGCRREQRRTDDLEGIRPTSSGCAVRSRPDVIWYRLTLAALRPKSSFTVCIVLVSVCLLLQGRFWLRRASIVESGRIAPKKGCGQRCLERAAAQS